MPSSSKKFDGRWQPHTWGDMLLLASISIAAAGDIIDKAGRWDPDLYRVTFDDKQCLSPQCQCIAHGLPAVPSYLQRKQICHSQRCGNTSPRVLPWGEESINARDDVNSGETRTDDANVTGDKSLETAIFTAAAMFFPPTTQLVQFPDVYNNPPPFCIHWTNDTATNTSTQPK